MGKTDCFTQFYPTGFSHWVKLPCQPCQRLISHSADLIFLTLMCYWIFYITLQQNRNKDDAIGDNRNWEYFHTDKGRYTGTFNQQGLNIIKLTYNSGRHVH